MDLLLLARLVLAIVFAIAGFAKLADREGTRALAKDFGVPAALAPAFAWLLPLAELATAIALIPLLTATLGALAALLMLVTFIAAIGVSLARGKRPDCRCFGQIKSEPVGWNTIVRNLVLSALALFIIVRPDVPDLNLNSSIWIGLLFLTTFGAFAMTFALLKQNGRLALRIEALEAKLGMDTAREPGLDIDALAPKVAGVNFGDTPVLLVFKSAGCGACEAMMPEVERWQREHQDRLHVVTVDDRKTSDAYLVDATPSAVLVTDGRIASHLVSGDEAIRSLVADATRPKPYAKGELVEPMQLPDLDGKPVDLLQLNGRKTVLLFWSPTCGFCVDSLDDVKWWERNRDPQLADLIVISTGDVASNRAQGFQSPVLIDHSFTAGSRFGADGTPSAVLVDERGRVASTVAGGAPEVLALAGSASPARPT